MTVEDQVQIAALLNRIDHHAGRLFLAAMSGDAVAEGQLGDLLKEAGRETLWEMVAVAIEENRPVEVPF